MRADQSQYLNNEKICGALIGLAGACNNNPKTDNTDHVVIRALALPVLCRERNGRELAKEEVSGIIDEIYQEKNAVAPDCAVCASPCGNTSDYDMSRIYEDGEETGDMKLKVLAACQGLAACVYRSGSAGECPEAEMILFYRALSYIKGCPACRAWRGTV